MGLPSRTEKLCLEWGGKASVVWEVIRICSRHEEDMIRDGKYHSQMGQTARTCPERSGKEEFCSRGETIPNARLDTSKHQAGEMEDPDKQPGHVHPEGLRQNNKAYNLNHKPGWMVV